MTDEITAIELLRVELPLVEPYHLSHVTVESFDTIFIRVETSGGGTGIGEVTTLDGYSLETVEESWRYLSEFADRTVGMSVPQARHSADEIEPNMSFTRSGAHCALYGLDTSTTSSLSAPVVGILSTDGDLSTNLQALQKQVAAGFDTVKVKIGFDPETDANCLHSYVDAAPADVEFRVDANQGYDFSGAQTFLDSAPLDQLQVVEQPLPVGQIEDHARLQAEYDTTIMLDEEIRTVDDVNTAATVEAAGAVKFKLMKIGSVERTISLIEHAQQLGFEVVLGNGVQAEVGCLYEAMIWEHTELELAGEFNGWLKQQSTLEDRVSFDDGQLVWAGGNPSLNTQKTNKHIVNTLTQVI